MANPFLTPKIVWDSIGIDPADLGCIMLDLELNMAVTTIASQMEADAYYANDQAFGYINGIQKKHHATLLYGLTIDPNAYNEAVAALLYDGEELLRIERSGVAIEKFDAFPASAPGHPDYACIVGHLDATDLAPLNERLRLLPHIDTWPDYKAHVTIGYVNKRTAGYWVDELNRALENGDVEKARLRDINLGSIKPWLQGSEDE